MKLEIGALLLAISAAAHGQHQTTPPYWSTSVSFGQSTVFLGSEDMRQGWTLGVAHAKHEPRFRFRSVPAELVVEGYVNRTGSVRERTSADSHAFGVLAMARWHGHPDDAGRRVFFDVGWGAQVADKRTRDLDALVNSTPVIDLGITLPTDRQEFFFGLRYLHISNAGLVGRNQGANYFLLQFGTRF